MAITRDLSFNRPASAGSTDKSTDSIEKTATIANGASLSGAVFVGDGPIVSVEIPSAWTTANLTFQGSRDGENFVDVYDEGGSEKTVVVGGASRRIVVDPIPFLGFTWIKIRSGTAASAVNQGAERTLRIITQR